MAAGARRGLTLFVLVAFAGTLAGVLTQRESDPVLRVEGYADEILAAAREAGLADPFLLAGLVYTESRGRAGARSSAGAIGLCQLLPSTAEEVARAHGIRGSLAQPEVNLRLGAHYLKELLDRWDGDADLALLSYRMGPSRVAREVEEAGSATAWKAKIQGRSPGPWDHRCEVLRQRDLFHERAAAGVGWPAAALVPARS